MWKQFISDYLSFSKKERNGILALLSLIVFFIVLPFFFPYFIKEKTYDHLTFKKAMDSLKIQTDSTAGFENRNNDKRSYQNNKSTYSHQYNNQPKGELFYFDPNTASPADWKKLGLRDKTIATIQNYLVKGGKFYKKEDIGKIWGLHEDEVQRLMPYIQIHLATNDRTEKQYEKTAYKKPAYTPAIVDINIADTASFIALPGIGSKLSLRIINFRDKLGGFYKVEQIGETYGLPDSTFQKIKDMLTIKNTELRKININTASVDEMKSHPYLRYALANAIVQYRTQHGNFTAITDLKKIMLISEDVYNRVSPYLMAN